MSKRAGWLTRHMERPTSEFERRWLTNRFSRDELSDLGGWILFLSQTIAWLGLPVGVAAYLSGHADALPIVFILTYGLTLSGIYVAARLSKIITQLDRHANGPTTPAENLAIATLSRCQSSINKTICRGNVWSSPLTPSGPPTEQAMQHLSTPLDTLSQALNAALWRDLPKIEYQDRDWEAFHAWKAKNFHSLPLAKKQEIQKRGGPEFEGPASLCVTKTRQHTVDDVEIRMFPQTWASTALGYGGLGGAAVTTAYTVVVLSRYHACVYFSGPRLAYRLDDWRNNAQFVADLSTSAIKSRRDAAEYSPQVPDET